MTENRRRLIEFGSKGALFTDHCSIIVGSFSSRMIQQLIGPSKEICIVDFYYTDLLGPSRMLSVYTMLPSDGSR